MCPAGGGKLIGRSSGNIRAALLVQLLFGRSDGCNFRFGEHSRRYEGTRQFLLPEGIKQIVSHDTPFGIGHVFKIKVVGQVAE
jgi:hypothetical protein